MNEWSPGGIYSRPGTPNHSGKSIPALKDELEKGSKPLVINIRAVSDNKVRSVQQHSLENITKSSVSVSCKNKKTNNGTSDPRFKRVISNSLQNDACIGTDAVSSNKVSLSHSEKDDIKQLNFFTGSANEKKSKKYLKNFNENNEYLKTKKMSSDEFKNEETLTQLEAKNFEQAEQPLKSVDKFNFNHDILVKSFSKESLSNCTVNTINTSMASDDFLDELPNELSMLSSVTRIKKVQNWMQDQKPKPLKKQSLITVIGQTQGHDSLSLVLNEINKRKRLVKELDKYAMCQKITEYSKGNEASESVEKINPSMSQKNEVKEIKCSSDVLAKNLKKIPFVGDGSGDAVKTYEEMDGKYGCINCAKSNFLNSLSQKRFSLKKKFKKNISTNNLSVKAKIKNLLFSVQCQWVLFLMFLTSGILCWITFSLLHRSFFKSFDFFINKPKTMTWHEKICMWLWELFRPSGNYKRSITWNSY